MTGMLPEEESRDKKSGVLGVMPHRGTEAQFEDSGNVPRAFRTTRRRAPAEDRIERHSLKPVRNPQRQRGKPEQLAGFGEILCLSGARCTFG